MEKIVKISDLIVDFFLEKGIDTCFSVTGGGAMHLNDSFGGNKAMNVVYNHHEQACSIAAEGYARISGKPALVCVTSGPGTTNALTGVLGAWLDSVPMIIISGQMKLETTISSYPLKLRQLGFQEFNIIDSVKNLTKYSEIITNPNYILYHLEKAYYKAINNRKGPVWLDIPLDIQSAKISIDNLLKYRFKFDNSFDYKLDKTFNNFIFDKINNAKRPVLLAGYGIRMENVFNEFQKIIEVFKIPILTEWNSIDLIDNDNSFFAGRPGSIGDRGGNFVLQNSDLVIALGCQLSIRQVSYAWSEFAKNAEIIAINNDRNELLKPIIKIDYPVKVEIKTFFKSILESKINSIHGTNSKWYKWVKEINNRYPVVTESHTNINNKFLSVYGFFKLLSNHISKDSITVLANGAACVVGLQSIEVKKGQRVFTNAGASSMGYAICAAIGAANASMVNPIYCIEGDGSIQMNIQELQTIVHNKLNLKIFWINNDGYHSIKQTQLGMFNASKLGFKGADKSSGISFPSAEKIAAAYGIKFLFIKSLCGIENTLTEMDDYKGPVICEVVVDPNENFAPKLQSKMLKDGTFITPPLDDMFPFLSDNEKEIIQKELSNI